MKSREHKSIKSREHEINIMNFQREVFERLIKRLNQEKVPYCILRNYEDIPERFGGDVDIFVLSEDSEKIEIILKKIAKDSGGYVWNSCEEKTAQKMPRSISILEEGGGNIEALHFDFLFKEEKFGVDYFDVRKEIENRRPHKDFFVLAEESEFLHILMHGMFQVDEKYKERYAKKLSELLGEERSVPKERIYKLFPSFIAHSIITRLERKNVDGIFERRRVNKLFFILKNKVLFKRLFSSVNERIIKKLKNFFCPPGEFAVILGPDGVGKSTAAEIAHKLMGVLNVPSYHLHLGFRPTVLPKRQKLGFGEPKKGKNYPFRDLLRYCYHFVDYWFGYWLHIRPRLVKGETVLAERYFYDYILHPSRKGTGVNSWFSWWTFRLFMPKPTTCILLTNSPEEILKRRQELTKEEIEVVLKKGKELGKTAKRFTEIKTDKPPELVAKEMVEFIMCGKSREH